MNELKANFTDKQIEAFTAISPFWEIRKYGLDDLGVVGKKESIYLDGKEIKRADREFKFYNEDTGIYNLSIKNKSVRIFTGQNRNIDDVITSDADYRKMMRLINTINADNMIMFKSSSKKKSIPASKKSISLMIGLSEKKTGEFLSRMKKHNIIEENVLKQYYVNPAYALGGKGIKVELYLMFRYSLDLVLHEQTLIDLRTIAYYKLNPKEIEDNYIQDDERYKDEFAPVIEDYDINIEVISLPEKNI